MKKVFLKTAVALLLSTPLFGAHQIFTSHSLEIDESKMITKSNITVKEFFFGKRDKYQDYLEKHNKDSYLTTSIVGNSAMASIQGISGANINYGNLLQGFGFNLGISIVANWLYDAAHSDYEYLLVSDVKFDNQITRIAIFYVSDTSEEDEKIKALLLKKQNEVIKELGGDL